ncbi:MAG: glycine cleavage system protein GcvH [Candidatus Omnitrophica bacterium]|nr:glycine cleavage system protein GcvH [Candidatus Omnitrophota bacterium]
MDIPRDLKYTKTHEWIKRDGTRIRIGITEYAQKELSDVVFVELPKLGQDVLQGRAACVVESVKAASDIYSPLSGKVVAVNKDLELDPALVNKDPYGRGWIFDISLSKQEEINSLLDANQYDTLIHQKA